MVQLDYFLFEWINQKHTYLILDQVLPWMRNGNHWIPLYIALLGYAFWRYGIKRALLWLCVLLFVVGLSDGISNYAFKKQFERARPCHEKAGIEVRELVPCGSGYSFTSSHATNHMAIAVFISGTLFSGSILACIIWMIWALAIGYAQIYVGLHYPFDVLAGFLLGASIATIGIPLYRILEKRLLDRRETSTNKLRGT